MKEVEVTAVLDVPRVEVERKLSPESIVEYAGTYTVESVEESDDVTVLTAVGEEIETVLEFRELDDGYVYSQRGDDGPFEEMHTRITVSENVNGNDDGKTRVTVTSEFTFGGALSFLTDWLGTSIRRDEVERLLTALALDLEGDLDPD
jgi:hypothetical protein